MVLKEACFVAEEDIYAAPSCKTLSENKKNLLYFKIEYSQKNWEILGWS